MISLIHHYTYLLSTLSFPCKSAHRATQSLYPSLSSARANAFLHVISMHRTSSRILSCQFFRGLPLLRFPSGLQSMACIARLSPSILTTYPFQRSLLLYMLFSISSCSVLPRTAVFNRVLPRDMYTLIFFGAICCALHQVSSHSPPSFSIITL